MAEEEEEDGGGLRGVLADSRGVLQLSAAALSVAREGGGGGGGIDYHSGQLTKAYPRSLRAMREEAKMKTLHVNRQNEPPSRRTSSVLPLKDAAGLVKQQQRQRRL